MVISPGRPDLVAHFLKKKDGEMGESFPKSE